jgi:hypothetical protein
VTIGNSIELVVRCNMQAVNIGICSAAMQALECTCNGIIVEEVRRVVIMISANKVSVGRRAR